MKARIAIARPDAVDVTLTITMPLGRWKELREQIAGKYPGWAFAELIARTVAKAEAGFTEEGIYEP